VNAGQLVSRITRVLAAVAVATQTTLLAIAMIWAVQHQASLSDVAGRQGGIFAASVLLAVVVFRLTALRDDCLRPQPQTGVHHG
jgi:hypothetical protein